MLFKMFMLVHIIIKRFLTLFQTPEEGAQTSIYLAVSEEVKDISGKYFVDCAVQENEANPISWDMGLAAKLWEVSESITGLTPSGTKTSE